MTDNGVFELATEIANRIAQYCESPESSQRIMHLIRELLETRWSISPKQSS